MPSYQTFATTESGDWDLRIVRKDKDATVQMLQTRLTNLANSDIWNAEGIDSRYFINDEISITRLLSNIQTLILGTAGVIEAEILGDDIVISNDIIAVPFRYRTIEDVEYNEDIFFTTLA